MIRMGKARWVVLGILGLCVVGAGLWFAARRCERTAPWLRRCERALGVLETPAEVVQPRRPESPPRFMGQMPISKLPGPPRSFSSPVFLLNERNSLCMTGMDDPVNERWCDIAGNFYASSFTDRFSYQRPAAEGGPVVRVRVRKDAPTLMGRIEAHGLKPNFAYQLKLRGAYDRDRRGFEAIGYRGRWRLPGVGTNYSDYDYQRYPFKDRIEAYLLFDFFVTDGRGDAVREFALDSSLHVLWNATRQGGEARGDDIVPAVIDSSSQEYYAHPKQKRSVELLWAEREMIRYRSEGDVVRLPVGEYEAEIVLTEESFHSPYNDGGYWATVCRVPVTFTVSEKPDAPMGPVPEERAEE